MNEIYPLKVNWSLPKYYTNTINSKVIPDYENKQNIIKTYQYKMYGMSWNTTDTDKTEQTEYSLLISYLMTGKVTDDFAKGKMSQMILLERKSHRWFC